jgi:subtilisin family serine protease
MKDLSARGRSARSLAWLLLALCCPVATPARAQALVDPELEELLDRSGELEVLVAFEGRQDWSGLDATLPRSERAAAVVTTLRARAARSQAGLLRSLEARGIEHRSHYVANVVWARVRRLDDLRGIAATPGVRRLLANERSSAGALPSTTGPKTLGSWGVERVGAAEAWASGHRGAGAVVGSIDTGVRWTHAALLDGYRGWSGGAAEHDYNWHDAVRHDGSPCGTGSPAPCDPYDHGTPTIAAAVGRPTEFAGEIGVAPEAEWIACRAIDVSGWGSPAGYVECLEFMLAPYPVGGSPLEGDPDRAPDVVVNSYSCGSCELGLLQQAFSALEAAGILAVAAAGNSGPDCGSLALPPALLREVFTIGAVNGIDEVAGLSSRGPAAQTALTKPDLVAPGLVIRSASGLGDERHDTYSGTSLAAPLVAGAAALALSAHPPLREDLPRLRALLERTSVVPSDRRPACGLSFEQRPNNNWGWGRLDAALAVRHAASPETELDCGDGRDDDGDRLVDCIDPDCAGATGCPGESSCSNRIDDDGNGLVDCWDASCLSDPACPAIAASTSLLLPELASQPVASLFDPACTQARWRTCPASLSVGAGLLNRLAGEGRPAGVDALTCYQHSVQLPDWRLQREGEDLVLAR